MSILLPRLQREKGDPKKFSAYFRSAFGRSRGMKYAEHTN